MPYPGHDQHPGAVHHRYPHASGQFEPTVEKFAQHKFQLEGMVSHYIPFSQVGKVFENIMNLPKDLKKMVIVFED